MTPELERLRQLVMDTPGAPAQLALAYRAAHEGRHAEAQIHCAIVADAINMVHPDLALDPVALAGVLTRLFTETTIPTH